MSVKGPWCNWSRLNGLLEHGKGVVARRPAMMSSIEALCGSKACHSFNPPPCAFFNVSKRVLFITLFHRSKSNNVVGRDNHEKAPSLIQSRPCYSYSEEFCLRFFSDRPLILSQNTHLFPSMPCGRHAALEKSPNHSLHQHGTQVPSHSLAFTRWNIPKKRGKTPGHHKFLFSLHFSPSLNAISKRENKQWPLTHSKKPLHFITQASSSLDVGQKPKNKASGTGWRHPLHSTLHHTRCHWT